MTASPQAQRPLELKRLASFKPDLYERVWSSTPHPTLPLLATTHNKAVTIFSLSTLSSHSRLTGGHERSVRSAAWKPGLAPHKLCLATGSFDSTSALWRWEQDVPFRPAEDGDGDGVPESSSALEVDVTAGGGGATSDRDDGAEEGDGDGWEFVVVLEGQENEIKCVAFSPSGQYLATCSRDKSIWIWEDVGGDEDEDEWETVAVLKEHDGDVKCVAWCPDVAGRSAGSARHYSAEALASASYDNTVRIWREDGDGDWVCVAVLEGHAGIVWGVQWEPRPDGDSYPRLASWSADRTIRIWTLQQEDEDHDGGASEDAAPPSCLIPNTMRRSLHERWQCAATLPAVHAREIYSATWSATTGLVASAGGDGLIAVYGEAPAETASDATMDQAAMELDGDDATNGAAATAAPSRTWRILATMANGHGPYEINHITWCRRFDAGSERRGVEEMLVTSGDDGLVVPWQVVS